MSASSEFKSIFRPKNLKKIYFSNIKFNSSIGIDGINSKVFEKRLKQNISIIAKKVSAGTYNFSQFREKLILRGADKNPRVISIPTLRDKLTLKALQKILVSVYKHESPSLHNTVSEVNHTVVQHNFNGLIRLDVKDYYPSIDHTILIKQLSKRIRKKEILILIEGAISQQTMCKGSKKNKGTNLIGLPQGLPISNILANIYMLPIDKKYKNMQSIKYFRYVDDILVFCDLNRIEQIKKEIIGDCVNIGLHLHGEEEPEKHYSGAVSSNFNYLGYSFKGLLVSVRDKSVECFRDSLIRTLTYYKYSSKVNISVLLWTMNLRITGCVFDDTKYGWLFYFSQINDIQLLASLDHFIQNKLVDFGVDPSQNRPKKLTRAYHEIKNNLSHTNYIPNFDQIDIYEKKKILQTIFNVDISKKSTSQIEYHFRRNIFRSIKDLERDLSNHS